MAHRSVEGLVGRALGMHISRSNRVLHGSCKQLWRESRLCYTGLAGDTSVTECLSFGLSTGLSRQ
jgi:hypothetical protein